MSQFEKQGSVEISPNEAASSLTRYLLKNSLWEKAKRDPNFLSFLEDVVKRAKSDTEVTPTQRVHERQVKEANAKGE